MNINLPLILLIITLVAGFIVLFDKLFWAKKRKIQQEEMTVAKTPFIIEQARSLFPILLIVFLFRSFIMQPFRVPSESLEPTVLPGDILIVSQFSYGLRFPVWNKKLISIGEPKRGDIIVIRWPVNSRLNFVKRVIGLPGDKISYIDKVLYINGKRMSQTFIANVTDISNGKVHQAKHIREDLEGVQHDIYTYPVRANANFYNLTVPKGMYFMMGDNRDDSDDSRFWGFVPDSYLIGKAFRIAFSWDSRMHRARWNRVGMKI